MRRDPVDPSASVPAADSLVVLAQGGTRELGELRDVLGAAGLSAWVTTPPGKNANC